MRVAVYVRVSTHGQADEDKVSIPDQIKWARELSGEQNWEFSENRIYQDILKGDTELEKRDGFIRLLNDAKLDKFDVVLVWHSSRIAREVDISGRFCRLLGNYKVQVYCRNIPFEVVKKENYYWGGNYQQQVMTSLAGVNDQQENVARSERVRSGFRGLAEKGHLVFAPYGYVKIYEIDTLGKRIWHFEINPSEAIVIEQMFDSYGVKGMTIRGVMRYLNDDKKLPSPKGGKWNTATIKNILNNPAYVGMVRWGRKLGGKYKQGKSNTGKQKRIITSKEKWVLEKGDQPPIIKKNLFDRVQKRLEDRGKIPGRTIASPGLMTGLVKCGICGKNAYHKARHVRKYNKSGTTWSGVRFDYICSTYISQGKNACRRHIMSAPKLHQLVISDIDKELHKALEEGKLKYNNNDSSSKELVSIQKEYEKSLKKLEKESSRLLTAYTKGLTTIERMGNEQKRIDKSVSTIQEKLDEINLNISKGDYSLKNKEKFMELAKDFDTTFNTGSFTDQKEFLHTLLEAVIVSKTGDIEIKYRL